MMINILGVKYTIISKNYNDDEAFDRRSIAGYCDGYTKRIVICKMSTYKGWEHEEADTIKARQNLTLRHEIVHAFLNESGLTESSHCENGSWARNEEMVEWIAVQGEKIYKAWQDAKAI